MDAFNPHMRRSRHEAPVRAVDLATGARAVIPAVVAFAPLALVVGAVPVAPAPGPTPDAVPVRLPDGRVAAIRPLQHGERGPLLAVFDKMSSASRARRYLTGMVRLPSTAIQSLTDVDGHRHMAWVASMHGEPVGIARCVRDDAGVADVAVEVVDDHHGLGIASALVDAVTTVAAARGVRRVRATLTPENEPSRRLVTRIGVRLHVVDHLLEGEGPLRLMHPQRIDRQAVLALARRWGDEPWYAESSLLRAPHLNEISTNTTEAEGPPSDGDIPVTPSRTAKRAPCRPCWRPDHRQPIGHTAAHPPSRKEPPCPLPTSIAPRS